MSALAKAEPDTRPIDPLIWAKGVQSIATFESGRGAFKQSLPALNGDSRKVLVAVCRFAGTKHAGERTHGGGAGEGRSAPDGGIKKTGGADQPPHQIDPNTTHTIIAPLAVIMAETQFSTVRLGTCFAMLKHAGLVAGPPELIGRLGAEKLRVDVHFREWQA